MNVNFHFNCLFLLIVFGISTPGFNCLKDVKISNPSYVRRGEDVNLSCEYDMEKDLLYVVKWYKFHEEFYRFLPKESPPQKVFPLQGIEVDISHSNAHHVLLKNVSLELTGKYKCVVSSEFPFHTLSDVKNLTVSVIGYDVPQLQLDQINYHPRDVVRANCTAQKTFPTPNVTWYINDREELRYSNVQLMSIPEQAEPPIFTTVSSLKFNLPEGYSPTKLTCRIRLFELYDESSTKRIQPISREYSVGGPDTLLRSNKSPPFVKSPAQHIHNNMLQLYILNIFIYFITYFYAV